MTLVFRICLITIILVAPAFTGVDVARCDTLGTSQWSGGQVFSTDPSLANFILGTAPLNSPTGLEIPQITLGNTLEFGLNSLEVGQTLYITPTSDPQFFSALENGTLDIGGELACGGDIGQQVVEPVSNFFTAPSSGNPVNFQGDNISSVSLTLDEFAVTSLVNGTPAPGVYYEIINYNLFVNVNGTAVPEPSTISILALGAGILFCLGLRQTKI